MPGGFHPFHAGHYALYKSAVEAFSDADVYVAATNDQKARPFPFEIKEKLAKLAGVATGHFVQVKSPFKAEEITSYYNPDEDVLIFVRSEKDRNEQPKPGGTKKDGTPSYFQPWTGKNLQPFSKHAYIAYLPTVEFGPGIRSATEIRNAWPNLNDRQKTAMVMSLYPATQKNSNLAKNVVQMLDIGMGGQVDEARNHAQQAAIAINKKEVSEAVGENYLYHSTEDAETAKKILSSGVFKAGLSAQSATDAQTTLPTVSFGRNLAYQMGGENVGRDYEVVFVVNRNALEQKYKTLGTSQSRETRGLAHPKPGDIAAGVRARSYDIDKNKTLNKQDADDIFAKGTITDFGKPASRTTVGQRVGLAKKEYFMPKSGQEFEEVVPTKTGTIPWNGILVGFYLVPKKAASRDPELLNHPLRLDMPRPNQFVKANANQSPSESIDYLEEN